MAPRIPRVKNTKFLGYYFCVNTNIKGDFQICISVPLKASMGSVQKFRPTKSTLFLLRTLNLETYSVMITSL